MPSCCRPAHAEAVAMDSIMQDTRECYFCGKNGSADPLDMHHVFGSSRKKKSDKYGLVVYLCHDECHIFGKYAVHKSGDKMQELHAAAQTAAMDYYGWSTEDFICEFGKNYL